MLFRANEPNLYSYVHENALNVTDIWGLAVEVCSGTAANSGLAALAALGVKRGWIRTDTKEVGLGGTFLNTQTEDHSGFGNLPGSVCEEEPMVDEDCVNRELQVGQSMGPWLRFVGDCWTYVSSILAKCSIQYGPSPTGGSEGASGYQPFGRTCLDSSA
jgi:hypothetical protein